MMNIFHFILLLFLINCSNIKGIESNDRKNIFNNINQDIEYNIELQKVQFEHLNYCQNNNFKIINNKSTNNDIFINFLSINCNINIDVKNNENDGNNIILLNYSEDSYSFLIKKEIPSLENIIFQVNPLMDIINGKYKYVYELRSCPLVINSGEYIEGNQINIETKEPTIFYFNDYLRQYNILYNVKNLEMNETFVTFYFLFDRKSKFEINILDNENNSNISSSIIENSTNIFLDYNKIKNSKILNISIYYFDNNYPIVLRLKIIENNSISILQNNYLNYGFITSRTSYQYYYMDIFKGEEGEIILHNKRANGHLYAFIIKKNNKDYEDIKNNNKNYYPNNKDTNYLEINGNTLKLKYNFTHTNECEGGCYLLLTYYHEPFLWNYTIGYEFTLLVKVWDDMDMRQQIINIPFNEYIFGYFEEDSINEHYYSIFLPNDIKELIVQIEGKNFDGFIGAGKKRLITSRKMENIDKLIITNKQMVFRYQIEDLSYINIYRNNYMSFAFRPIDYFVDIFSYYSLRIFYLKENEDLIIPLDSNIGSICQPTKGNNSSNFYCYFMLKNINNLYSLSYSISTANINKNINLYYLKKYDNTYHKHYTLEYRKVQNFWFDEENNVDLIIFKFEFNDNQIQKIMLTFFDPKAEFYPHIYSSQMHQLKGLKSEIIPKTFKFSLPKTFSFIITFIHGAGALKFEDKNMDTVYFSSNLKGQPFFYSLFDVNNLKIIPKDRKNINFMCKTELDNIIRNNGIRELTVGEPMNEIIINKQIPFFYYIKYNKNIDINFRLINNDEIISPSGNETTNFDIEGYILEYKYIEKKLKGEYIELKKPTKGYYDLVAKTGLFQINEESNENDKYLLIKIDAIKGTNKYIDSNLIIQTISMYLEGNAYILPINQYIAGRFNNEEDKNYLIQVSEWEKMVLRDYLIEFSANYEDLIIEISEDSNITFTNETGIKKYMVSKVDEDIKIKLKNPNKRPNANYIIRYFSTTLGDEYNYTFIKTHKTFKMEDNSDDTVNFKFEFEKIKIHNKGESVERNDVYFEIYSSLFVKEKIDNNEKLDTIATLSSKASFSDKIITNYMKDSDFNISFKNITREFYKYNLQIKIHVLIKDSFLNEDYLVYSIPIDLTNYLKRDEKSYIFFILIPLLAIIIVIIIIFCIIYNKLKKQNLDLKEKVLSISFSSGMTKDVLEEEDEGRKSKKDEDYETTFI